MRRSSALALSLLLLCQARGVKVAILGSATGLAAVATPAASGRGTAG